MLNFVLSSGSVGNNTIPINQTVEIPCVGRYIKITASAAFAATICLRQGSHFTNANIISISGATPVSTGVSGILAVGGNIANGVAPTANPNLVAGIDTTGLTRRVLTDTAGRVLVSGVTQAGATAALPLFGNSATPSLAQTDTGTIDSFTQYDLLAEVVTQLRILNRNFFEANVGQLSPVSDDPDVLRADYSTLTTLN